MRRYFYGVCEVAQSFEDAKVVMEGLTTVERHLQQVCRIHNGSNTLAEVGIPSMYCCITHAIGIPPLHPWMSVLAHNLGRWTVA